MDTWVTAQTAKWRPGGEASQAEGRQPLRRSQGQSELGLFGEQKEGKVAGE